MKEGDQMIDVYKIFGNCFMFDFESDLPLEDVYIEQLMKDKRMKGFFVESHIEGIDGEIKDVYRMVVFDTYQPKARDLCFLLNGRHFQRLDTWTVAYMCNFLGIKLHEHVTLYDLSRMYDNYDLMA